MGCVLDLVLSRNWFLAVDVRALSYLLARDRDGQQASVPVGLAGRNRGDQHLSAFEPSARFDDHEAGRARLVVEGQIGDATDGAIDPLGHEVVKIVDASQHIHVAVITDFI